MPEERRAFIVLDDQTAVAAVLGRAGLADSARAGLVRALRDPQDDPGMDLRLNAAWVHELLGERDRALDMLKAYVSVRGVDGERALGTGNWRWRELQGDARFRRLLGV